MDFWPGSDDWQRIDEEATMRLGWGLIFGALVGLLAAGLILLVASPPRGQPVSLLPAPTTPPLVVHVTGAVHHPGVYNLPVESRVQDAIEAAGGALPNGFLNALNLAAPLQDGERLIVPTEPPAGASQDTQPPSVRSPGQEIDPAALSGLETLININTAGLDELESLPGIGPKTAQKIIDYRENNGLFDKIEAIQDVSGIGPVTFEGIKDLITVEPGF